MTEVVSKTQPRSGSVPLPSRISQDLAANAYRQPEDKLLRIFVIVSALLHLLVVLFQGFQFKKAPLVLQDEGGIVADLVSDIDVGAKESAQPDTVQGEHRVKETMLPQLPKTFKIDEPQNPDLEASAPPELKQDDVAKPAPPPEQPQEEQKPVETTAETKPAEQPKKAEEASTGPSIKTPDDSSANKLKKEDALKRLMDEQARQEQKFAKEKQAENQDSLAIAAAELSKKGISFGGKGNGAAHNRYGQKLKHAVQPHYNIPEVYRLKAHEYVVAVTIQVAENGALMSLDLEKSSGIAEFDESVMRAIRDAVPLPAPPADLAGERITVNFSP